MYFYEKSSLFLLWCFTLLLMTCSSGATVPTGLLYNTSWTGVAVRLTRSQQKTAFPSVPVVAQQIMAGFSGAEMAFANLLREASQVCHFLQVPAHSTCLFGVFYFTSTSSLHPIWTHIFFLDKSSIPCCFPLLPLQFVNALCFSLSHFSSYSAFCFTGFQQKHRITHHNCACAPTKYLLESPEGQHPCESVLTAAFMLVLHNCSNAGKCKCVYHNGSVCTIFVCVPDKKTASSWDPFPTTPPV